jgi:hypothetical protein
MTRPWFHGLACGDDGRPFEFQYNFDPDTSYQCAIAQAERWSGGKVLWIEPGQWPAAESREGNWVNFEEEEANDG